MLPSKNTGIDGLITDGEEGFLIDVQNENSFPSEFNQLLETLVKNPTEIEKMSRRARSLAEDYAWDKITPKYTSLYRLRAK